MSKPEPATSSSSKLTKAELEVENADLRQLLSDATSTFDRIGELVKISHQPTPNSVSEIRFHSLVIPTVEQLGRVDQARNLDIAAAVLAGHDLEEIARKYGLTTERVSQISAVRAE